MTAPAELTRLDLVYAIADTIVAEYRTMLDDDPAGDEHTTRRAALEVEARSRLSSPIDIELVWELGELRIFADILGHDVKVNLDTEATRIARLMSN